MDVLVTCKYEDYPIKNEGARVVTTMYINSLDAKGCDFFLVGNPWTFGTESPDDTGEQKFVHLFNYCFVTD